MIELFFGNQSVVYVSYLGFEVKVVGGMVMMLDGQVFWVYDVFEDVEGIVEILNENGSVVYMGDISFNVGGGIYIWDGEMSNGSIVFFGVYII